MVLRGPSVDPGPDTTVAMFIGYDWAASLQPPTDVGKKGETSFLNRVFKIVQEKKKKWRKLKIGPSRAAILSLDQS